MKEGRKDKRESKNKMKQKNNNYEARKFKPKTKLRRE